MALAPATAYCLIRSEGMGDMLLALGAAKALKRLRGALIFLGTNKQHVSLARACPHVDEVFTNNDEFQTIIARYPDVHVTVAQFDRASFGIAPRHQTDAYLDELGVSAPPEEKNIELRTDAAAAAQVASTCANCSAGYYSSASGAASSAACRGCSPGSYSPWVGAASQTLCAACPAGSYSTAPAGSTIASCRLCASGGFSSIGATACLMCAAGLAAVQF